MPVADLVDHRAELASSARVARSASGSSASAAPGRSAALIVAVAAYDFGASRIPAATAAPVITRISTTSGRWRQSATPTSRTSIIVPTFAQTTGAQTPLVHLPSCGASIPLPASRPQCGDAPRVAHGTHRRRGQFFR